MKNAIQSQPAERAPAIAPPNLRVAEFDDYEQIIRLESSEKLGILPADQWKKVWLDNPLWPELGKDWPIGWVLEDANDRVVGCLSNVPSLYTFKGQDLVSANGRGWVVAPEYRSYALWLMDEYFNQPNADLFINTTVNQMAVHAFSALCARVPVGDWETANFWVTGHQGFANSALRRMNIPMPWLLSRAASTGLWIKDTMVPRPPRAGSVKIEMPQFFDSRFDQFWAELLQSNPGKLMGYRDCKWLAWHYSIPMNAGKIWIITASRQGRIRAFCVLKRQDAPFDMRRMRVVDFQSLETDIDLLPDLLHAALDRCMAEGIHVLENFGTGLPKFRSFDRCAPYRRKLLAWPFYYRATSPEIEKSLKNPQAWDPSLYDGDASFD